MTMSATDSTVIDEIRRLKGEGHSQKSVSRNLMVAWRTVKKYWDESVAKPEPEPKAEDSLEYSGDTAKYSGFSDKRITTDKEMIEHAGMDPLVWRVKEWGCGAWTTTAKKEELVERGGKTYKIKTPVTYNNWKVWGKFERLMPQPYMDAVKEIFESQPVKYRRPIYIQISPKSKPDPIMAIFALFDPHFGKLCCAEETGENQDLQSIEEVYANAVGDLMARISGYLPEKILFPIGNDFVHIDSDNGTTTGGTRVENVGLIKRVIKVAHKAQINAAARLSSIAPVDCFHVPGNHDELGSYYMALGMSAWFRNHPSVSVDLSPASRKYRRYGATMLGFIHGHKLRSKDINTLAGVMMHEQRDNLQGTRWSEWITGHNHRSMSWEDVRQGVMVRSINSLSSTDGYHFDHGFIGQGRRTAEVHLYHKDEGHIGHFVALARTNAA